MKSTSPSLVLMRVKIRGQHLNLLNKYLKIFCECGQSSEKSQSYTLLMGMLIGTIFLDGNLAMDIKSLKNSIPLDLASLFQKFILWKIIINVCKNLTIKT